MANKQARVLVTFSHQDTHIPVNSIIEADATLIDELESSGSIDSHHAAVEYAKSTNAEVIVLQPSYPGGSQATHAAAKPAGKGKKTL